MELNSELQISGFSLTQQIVKPKQLVYCVTYMLLMALSFPPVALVDLEFSLGDIMVLPRPPLALVGVTAIGQMWLDVLSL